MKELLCPAGNFESLKYAVNNGADAVYLAGKKYGARKFANNFTEDELVDAIKYCHLYGVKIYVTVNTIMYEDELDDALEYLKFLHINGVDAVIIQDIGLIKLAHDYLPNLELHASTQLHNHNIDQINYLKSLGVTRVVLAREISLDEIKDMNIDMEIEAFIHGALCVSYSGQCYYSSMLLDRSGNRGACAGLCRLPYTLCRNGKSIIKDKYLLSPKELNTSYYLDKLMDSNITSFKIEGRMKSPEYVGFITKYYRELIDNYYLTHCVNVNKEKERKLKTLFNRKFTKGYILGENNYDLMNCDSSNHVGIEIGKVLDFDEKKIKIKLNDDLCQEDGIRFVNSNKGMIANFIYDKNMKLINGASTGDIIYLDNKVDLSNCDKVNKTISKQLNNEISKYIEKKILINCKYKMVGNMFVLTYDDGENEVSRSYDIISDAVNAPINEDDIIKHVSKLGSTPFFVNNVEGEYTSGKFIQLGKINEIRRELINDLIELRSNKKKDVIINEVCYSNLHNDRFNKINLSVLVRNEEQLKVCLSKNVSRIYVTDYSLYQKYKYLECVYYRLPRVMDKHNKISGERLLCSEFGSIVYSNDNITISDWYLNVVNSQYVNYLVNNGVKLVTLSVELNPGQIKDILNKCDVNNIECIIYTTPEVMLIKNNLLTVYDDYKSSYKYELIDRNNSKYPIRFEDGYTYLFYYKSLNRINDLDTYKNMNICNYRIELVNENLVQTSMIIDDFLKKI